MKIFIKVLLFVLTSLVTNVNVVSASIPFSNIQEVTTSYSFHKELSEIDFKFIENDLINCCQNEQDLVDYRNRGKEVGAVAAKTGGNAFRYLVFRS